MLWADISASIAMLGVLGAIHAFWKRDAAVLAVVLLFFSSIALIQTASYFVLDKCSETPNQMLTYLSYLHLCFQPFFINALALYFIPHTVSKRIKLFVIGGCFVACVMMVLKAYPFPAWAGYCTAGDLLCGKSLCTAAGMRYLSWAVPLNQISENVPWYLLVAVCLPLLYGSWKFVLYAVVTGPVLARLMTENANEWPAIWCLISTVAVFAIVKTSLRRLLFVKKYWLWHIVGWEK